MSGIYEIGMIPIEVVDFATKRLIADGFTMQQKNELLKIFFHYETQTKNSLEEADKKVYDIITKAIADFREERKDIHLEPVDAEDVFMEICF